MQDRRNLHIRVMVASLGQVGVLGTTDQGEKGLRGHQRKGE